MGILIATTFLLAYFSWKYVETPFRHRRISRRSIFIWSALCSLFFAILGLTGHYKTLPTLWASTNPHLTNVVSILGPAPYRPCHGIKLHGTAECRIFGKGGRRVVIWGDSHASVLADNAPRLQDTELVVLSHFGCPPLVGTRRIDGLGNAANCSRTDILSDYGRYVATLAPDAIILVGRWTLYLNGWQKEGVLQAESHFISASDLDEVPRNPGGREALLTERLRETVTLLASNARIFILMQPPDFSTHGFKHMEHSDFIVPINEMALWHHSESTVMRSLDGLHGISVLDPKPLFCSGQSCRTRDAGTLMYFDDNHLSAVGAAKVWTIILGGIESPDAAIPHVSVTSSSHR